MGEADNVRTWFPLSSHCAVEWKGALAGGGASFTEGNQRPAAPGLAQRSSGCPWLVVLAVVPQPPWDVQHRKISS